MPITLPDTAGRTVIKKHPAHRYAEDVLDGKINVCLRARQACQRYAGDLLRMEEKGWTFNYKEAAYVIDWFSQFLRHPQGIYANQPFHLLPWQQFIIWNIHGFQLKNGNRRFKYSYVQIPKKNGKTTLGAGHSLFMLMADAEQSPEVYYSATTRDQAKIAFREAGNIVRSSPALWPFLKRHQHSISCESNFGFAKPLSSDANTQEGINVFYALIDEYHVHETDEMYNGLKAGMIARTQPLHSTITTAGFNTLTPCYTLYEECCDLLDGKFEDDSRFAIIYEIDKEDDWTDPDIWKKANPSIGHGVTIERMMEEFVTARNSGGTQITNFKTKHLNIWVNAKSEWISDDVVKEIMPKDDPWPDTSSMRCYLGLDLAATSDITALAKLYIAGPEEFLLEIDMWIPEDILLGLQQTNSSHPYVQWCNLGYIKTTPGNVTDYDALRMEITGVKRDGDSIVNTGNSIMQTSNVMALAYDRFNSSQLVIYLTDDGVNMYPHGQGFVSMSSPTQTFERLVMGKKLRIRYNPAVRWMIGNVALDKDAAGNVKPNKKLSKNKIDGIVAGIMAIGAFEGAPEDTSSIDPEAFRIIKI